MRKIIQIATAYDLKEDVTRLHALCNDGTVLEFVGGIWVEIEPIPQPKIQQKDARQSDLAVNTVFIDECHLVSPDAATMYGQVRSQLTELNPSEYAARD